MKTKRISKTTTYFWMKGMEKNNLHDLGRFKLRPNCSNMSHKSNYTNHMSNGKIGYPGCLGDWLGMGYRTQLYGDYFINHEIRIPSLNNQYDSRKVRDPRFFFLLFRGSHGCPILAISSWNTRMWLESPCDFLNKNCQVGEFSRVFQSYLMRIGVKGPPFTPPEAWLGV